ncbi:hypothetical protein CNMCM6069_001599 [Aspergillus lentulus]|nr:hypothetical protein CNMCM6069_001599 [Aspergillus lentulus]
MKPLTYLSLFLGISTTTTLAALRPDATPDEVAAAKAECGSMGVMIINPAELPEGITMSDVRMCTDHPLGPGAYPGLGPRVFARFRQFLPS